LDSHRVVSYRDRIPLDHECNFDEFNPALSLDLSCPTALSASKKITQMTISQRTASALFFETLFYR
jgi:hypothetical protein